MGRIIAQLVDNKAVVTKYESNFVIPENLSQERIELVTKHISANLDTDSSDNQITIGDEVVSRKDFLYRLLSSSNDCIDRYSVYGKGLYSSNDMLKGITWSEVAYLLYYVGGVARTLNWSSITPSAKYKVCVLQEIVDEKRLVNEKLAMYKNRLDMDYYIKSIREGNRYIPLPLYCAFRDLINNEDVEIHLEEDFLFKKVSRSELEELLGSS